MEGDIISEKNFLHSADEVREFTHNPGHSVDSDEGDFTKSLTHQIASNNPMLRRCPAADPEYVRAIAAKIEDGSYNVSALDVANRMIVTE